MNNYATARAVLSFLTFVAWSIVAVSVATFIFGSTTSVTAALAIALPLAATGFILVAMVQIARAQIDTAMNTSEICALLRRAQAAPASTSPSAVESRRVTPEASREPIATYKGEKIYQASNGYLALGEIHYTVAAAERAIDAMR